MKSGKLIFFVALAILLSQLVYAQDKIEGNGQVVKQQRSLGSFSKLSVQYGIRVRITTGAAGTADLEGESNILEYVATDVKNNELTVMMAHNKNFSHTKAVTVTIHVPKLDQVDVSTGCSVEADLPLQSDNLTATVETGSRLTAPINTKKLTLTVKEGSQANLQGTTTNANIHMSAAGKLSADKLTITNATVQVSGASKADIHVTGTLSASADGVSMINYSGNPTVKSQEVSGMSKIRKQ